MDEVTTITAEMADILSAAIGVGISSLGLFLGYWGFVLTKRFMRTGTFDKEPMGEAWSMEKWGDDDLYQKEIDYARAYERKEWMHKRRQAVKRSRRNRPNLP